MNYNDIGERQVKAPVRALMINRDDNVALLLGNAQIGEAIMVNGRCIEIAQANIPVGYHVAAYPLEAGASIIAGNQIIGIALRPIQPGEVVHSHNLRAA